MRADGHAPGRPARDRHHAPDAQDDEELLRRCATDVAAVAEGIREVSARTGAALRLPALTASAHRRPRTALAARWALLRALTDRHGLGGPVLTAPYPVRRAPGREELARLVGVTALRLKIAAVLVNHPELAHDPGMRRLTAAVAAGSDPAAVRALRRLFQDPHAQRALAGLAPLMAELPAVRALLDAAPSTGPDRCEGAAEAVGLTDQEKQVVATEGSLLGFLRNIEVLSTDGRILVQNVRGPDGVVRYVVQAPGTVPGRPRTGSPHAGSGAWRDPAGADPPHTRYTRSVLLALREHGIPRGADLALIGHGEGGTVLLNLARDRDFCRAHRVTHVIAVGSPPAGGQPADPRTWVARIADRHDLAARPEAGRAGAADPFSGPHPNRYEVDYPGPIRAYPACHLLRAYIAHLRTVVPEVRENVDQALTPYRGTVVRTQAYRVLDRAHPPEGHPFLTLPTASVRTATGPVEVPVRYYDTSAVHLCFPVDARTARTLLPDTGRMAPSRLGGHALAVLSLYEHRCSTIGPYAEIALSLPVGDPWRPRPYDVAADLLRRLDLRRSGRHVLSLAVSSEEARTVSQEVWGQQALLTGAEADLAGHALRLAAPDLGLTVEGRLGPGIPCPDADWVLYGRRGEGTVRTLVRTHGRPRLHTGAGTRLRLDTAAAEPMAGQLRRLGLDTARPLFVLACPRVLLHRSAGALLPC
ncbi:hypothetical protein ACWDFL_31075 [Streptomyces bungoensis]